MTAEKLPIHPGDIISYMDMCRYESASLQRGMNFRLAGHASVILMSLRPGAPYSDRIEQGGEVIIYEGHDIPKGKVNSNPKGVDQMELSPVGTPTQNGMFWNAAMAHKDHGAAPELVRVYEKIKTGIWAYAGLFELIDAWKQEEDGRKVFKFKLQLCKQQVEAGILSTNEIGHDRLIPTHVKIEVWKRDKGKCVLCDNRENLHFDHILPFSKGEHPFWQITFSCCVQNTISQNGIKFSRSQEYFVRDVRARDFLSRRNSDRLAIGPAPSKVA